MFCVLVVDDEYHHRQLLQAIVETLGHEVRTEDTGQRALLYLGTHQIDLVVADLEMSETEGITLIAELKQRFPSTFIIAVGTNPARGIQALEAGADVFIEKPFSYDTVTSAVSILLRNTPPTHLSVNSVL